MTRAATRALLRKEVRAVLPIWTAVTATLLLAAFGDRGSPATVALAGFLATLAFSVGTIAIGAFPFAHEYIYGTLPVLLAQPIGRRRMFAVKALVSGAAVATVAVAFAWLLLTAPPQVGLDGWPLLAIISASALCLAPYLTMATGHPLAGMTFALGTAGTLFVMADWFAFRWYGAGGTDTMVLRATLFRGAFAVACAAGLLLSWRGFLRIESTSGAGVPIDLTFGRKRAAVAARPGTAAARAFALARKELHVQQLAFVVAAIFFGAYVAYSVSRGHIPDRTDRALFGLAPLYLGLLALLVGAMSSAEERQLGVLQGDALLPVPAWFAWTVKVVVTLVVALVLGVLLPGLLLRGIDDFNGVRLAVATAACAVTVYAMFVSSLSSSGTRALAYAAVGIVGVNWYLNTLSRVLVPYLRVRQPYPGLMMQVGWLACMGVFLLALAYANHRSEDHGRYRAVVQIGALAVLGALTRLALFLAVAGS